MLIDDTCVIKKERKENALYTTKKNCNSVSAFSQNNKKIKIKAKTINYNKDSHPTNIISPKYFLKQIENV